MSNASLKEQLQAVASELSDTLKKDYKSKKRKFNSMPTQSPTSQFSADKLKKPKPKWLDYAQYGVELLKVYFPAAFKSPRDIQPLKKGIKQDLVKRLSEIQTIVTDDKACMVKSLAFYVNTAAYHKSVVQGVNRIDLDGKEAGMVTQEEATYSAERHKLKLDAKQNKQTNENIKPVENKK